MDDNNVNNQANSSAVEPTIDVTIESTTETELNKADSTVELNAYKELLAEMQKQNELLSKQLQETQKTNLKLALQTPASNQKTPEQLINEMFK